MHFLSEQELHHTIGGCRFSVFFMYQILRWIKIRILVDELFVDAK